MPTNYGSLDKTAPEFKVTEWLDNNDVSRCIADIDAPVIYLYCFQSMCPGCHAHGFPTMKAVKDHYERIGQADKVEFIAIQTVFEGFDSNTAEAGLTSTTHHGLEDIAVGHDVGEPPVTMMDYQTRGTPWTIIIGPDRKVRSEGFGIDEQDAIALIDEISRDSVQL